MTIGSHQSTIGKSQVHLTPRWILDALGEFDTDPCAADPRPWDCARINYTEVDDGLSRKWHNRVWLNPPFHRYHIASWLECMSIHNNGIALVHARTETEWFQYIWGGASAPHVLTSAVRRLTPRECERLMGFPDDYSCIPYRGKPASECPDGPRYKALGNSWAVPLFAWVGRRIQMAVSQ